MKLRLLLWVLGRMMKRAARKNGEFRKLLSGTGVVYQIMTMDGSVVRYYALGDGIISTQPLSHTKPDCIIRLRDVKYGFSVLTSKEKNAFMQGILQEDIVIDGSITLLMQFQKLTGLLRNKKKPKPGEIANIGFIGTGLIGAPMVRSLLRSGFNVLACDKNPEVLKKLVRDGAIACSNIADLADAGAVLIMVNNIAQVNSVVDELCEALSPDAGTYLLVMSTVSPDDVLDLRKKLNDRGQRGIHLLDAPVSGAPLLADAGKLSIMVGGEKPDFDKVMSVLEAMGDTEKIFFMGPLGSGSAMKLVNNSVALSSFMFVCEAMELGMKNDLEPDLMARVLNQSSGKNFITEQWPLMKKLFQMLLDDTVHNAKESILMTGLKDLETAKRWADKSGMPLKTVESAISQVKDINEEELMLLLKRLIS